MLAKLGYTFEIDELDGFTAAAFILIGSTISELETAQMKKLNTKGRTRK